MGEVNRINQISPSSNVGTQETDLCTVLETCLRKVEAVINQRPLTYVTEDQYDLIPLTPAKFLGEATETSGCPEETALNAPAFRQTDKKLVQLREELRTRFKREYLSLLAQRGSEKGHRTFKVGEIVLVASDNVKRIAWPLAVILELIPGKDGHVRVARLRTQNGIYIRPVQRLYPLEISDKLDLCNNDKDSDSLIEVYDTPEQVPNSKYVTRSGREVKKPKRYQ